MVVIYSIKHFCACYEEQLAVSSHGFVRTIVSPLSYAETTEIKKKCLLYCKAYLVVLI